jgi:phosphoglycerate dehydrogenase-like enzyme
VYRITTGVMTGDGSVKEIVISGATFPLETARRLERAGFTLTFVAGDLHEDEIVGALAGAWGYVLGGAERMTASAWDSVPGLRCVCVLGTGVEPYLQLPGHASPIAFTYTPGANAVAVAEFAAGMCVGLVRGVASRAHGVSRGEWLKLATPSLAGATVGIVGMGRVGRQLARMLQDGFAANVCYWNRSDRPELASLPYTRCGTVLEVMQMASLVSLHCAYVSGENDGMVGLRELQALGADGYLVNTARAQLVDPTSLRTALETCAIAGVALDGYYVEPAPAVDHDPFGLMRYLATDRLIVTPHCAYLTSQAIRAMAEMAADNLIAVAAGSPAPHEISQSPRV